MSYPPTLPAPSLTPLLSALKSSDVSLISSLTSATTPIHSLSSVSLSLGSSSAFPLTPLQLALSLPSAVPLHALLNSFFQTQDKSEHGKQIEAVLDELIQRIYPSFRPTESLTPDPHIDPTTTKPQLNGTTHPPISTPAGSIIDDIITRVDRAIISIRSGSFVVICDGADRENEGDLIIAAEKATTEKIAFMVNETSGLICVGLTSDRVEELDLPQMVSRNTESHQTAFTVSVDYKIGTTTGISASDRAATIRALASPSTTTPASFARPGHIFPLRARPGGVLTRPGHTEASVDIARLAGLYPAGAMCEIVNRDGSMGRPGELKGWAKRHGLECIDIKDLIEYRKWKEADGRGGPSKAAVESK